MKSIGQVISETKNYDIETGLYSSFEMVFVFLGTKYKAELKMVRENGEQEDDLKPYFMLINLDKNVVVLRTSEKINYHGPMSNHSDEVTESLREECIDWVVSHS